MTSIQAIREVPQQPVVVVAPKDKTNFTGEGEGKQGTGLFLPLLTGAAVGGATYLIGAKPTTEGILGLKDKEAVDSFVKKAEAKITKLAEGDAKTAATAAIGDIKTKMTEVVAKTGDDLTKAKEGIKEAIKTAAEKLPKMGSVGKAALWGGAAAVGMFILAKIFGGNKEA